MFFPKTKPNSNQTPTTITKSQTQKTHKIFELEKKREREMVLLEKTRTRKSFKQLTADRDRVKSTTAISTIYGKWTVMRPPRPLLILVKYVN